MAVEILGKDSVYFTFTDPKTGRRTTNRWWGERGLIHYECQSTGDYGSMTVKDCLLRLQAHADMIRNSRKERGGYLKPDDIAKYQSYVDEMIVVCQKAQQQGMPDNPAHSRQKAQEFKAKRHSRMVVVPGLAHQM